MQLLAGLAWMLKADDSDRGLDIWRASTFAWIRSRPSRQKGTIGEALVAGWAAAKGFDVARSPDPEADRLINGRRVEIKYSNLWAKGGYKFQQIRDQDYEFCLCLGISPFDAHAWFIPKQELMSEGREGLRLQHGGQSGHDTRWLFFPADSPPRWLAPYGGCLADVAGLIERFT